MSVFIMRSQIPTSFDYWGTSTSGNHIISTFDNITVHANITNNSKYDIKAGHEIVFLPNTNFQEPVSQAILSLNPYSINTFKIVLKKEMASAVKDILLENSVKIAQMGEKIVVFSTDKTLIQSVLVHSIIGQMLDNKVGFNSEMVEMDGAKYPTGVHFFTVKTENEKVIKKVFIRH